MSSPVIFFPCIFPVPFQNDRPVDRISGIGGAYIVKTVPAQQNGVRILKRLPTSAIAVERKAVCHNDSPFGIRNITVFNDKIRYGSIQNDRAVVLHIESAHDGKAEAGKTTLPRSRFSEKFPQTFRIQFPEADMISCRIKCRRGGDGIQPAASFRQLTSAVRTVQTSPVSSLSDFVLQKLIVPARFKLFHFPGFRSDMQLRKCKKALCTD